MKSLLVLLFIMSHAIAAPVLNKNMAAEGTFVTIWPDHTDPDHFYFAPNFMKIAYNGARNVEYVLVKNNNGDVEGAYVETRPLRIIPADYQFHFMQFRSGECDRRRDIRRGNCHYKAMISSLLTAGYEAEQLTQAQAGIKKIRPNARFSAIPFLSSKVEFGTTLDVFIDEHDCSPRAGQAADEIPCSITLNKRGITNLMPFLNSGSILPFKFIYKIAGVIEGANGIYKDESLDYGLTVNMGGEILIKHPELDVPFIWEE